MSNFKIAVLSIFSVAIVVGIAIFAMSKSGGGVQSFRLTVWGTISQDAFDQAYRASPLSKDKNAVVTYVKKDQASFDNDFVNALADGVGPDVILLREDQLYKNRNKIFPIPYASFPARTFKDTYIEGSEIFMMPEGIIGVPFSVDPLVMYWNRDIFNNNLISEPPKYWDEVLTLTSKITHKDNSGTVTSSAVALGEWNNVTNVKGILSTMFLQAGTPIIKVDGNNIFSVLDSSLGEQVVPGQYALNYYTQFANPNSAVYSWNRSLPSSLNMFVSGNLAIYFGYGSELFSIQNKNPNLNFDVASIPQIRDSAKKVTFGHIYAMSIVKQSKQVSSAFGLITSITQPASLKAFELSTTLPPARRDLLSSSPSDPYRAIFYSSSLLSHSWLDPDPSQSDQIFKEMIESITSGRAKVSQSLSTGSQELDTALK